MFIKNFLSTSILFDFSDIVIDSQNKMIVGKMKVEHKGTPINKFVGLKSKMYSML